MTKLAIFVMINANHTHTKHAGASQWSSGAYLSILGHHDVRRMSVTDAKDERCHTVTGTGLCESVNGL